MMDLARRFRRSHLERPASHKNLERPAMDEKPESTARRRPSSRGRLALFAIAIVCVHPWLVHRALAAGSSGRPTVTPYDGLTLPESINAIGRAYRQGRIDEGELHYYRVAALRAPHLLPPRWQPVEMQRSGAAKGDSPSRRGANAPTCYTSVMTEAFQALRRLDEPARGRISDLLAPPSDFEHQITVEEPFPFRLSYADPEDETLAQVAVEAIVASYQAEVVEWGFWEPPIEPGTHYYRFYLDDISGYAAGYTAPYAENYDTEHKDAFTYIVLNNRVGVQSMRGLVAHELNHACQSAMDVYEMIAFMENTSSYIETRVDPMSWVGNMYMIHVYQHFAYRPLEYMRTSGSDLYEYGGCLWTWFLTSLYGEDDPAFIRQIWEGTVQTTAGNEPDYFDALDEMLQDTGGFREMVKTFARYRFFVGKDDDGQHLEGSYRMWDGEVSKVAELRTDELPVRDASPIEQMRPQPNGCNYVTLDVADSPDIPIRFSVQAEPTVDWYVTVLRTGDDRDTTHSDITLDESGSGRVVVNSAPLDRFVLVVCQLAPADYDPDDREWTAVGYTYSIEKVHPAPTVDSVTPTLLARGLQSQAMTIYGSGFVDGSDLIVELSGDMVSAVVTDFVSSEEIVAAVTVGGTAEKTARDLRVLNPGGNEGLLPDAISIVDKEDIPNGDKGKGSEEVLPSAKGCQCRAARSSRGDGPTRAPLTGLLLLSLLSLALLRIRR